AKLAEEAQRFAHRDAIAAACEPWFRARMLAQVRTALDAGGVCWGLYQTATQMLARDGRAGSANPLFERIAHRRAERPVFAGAGLPRAPAGWASTPTRCWASCLA
ncbi:hypothetical protein OMF39_19555, partial [Bordetella pertussis]